MTTSPTCVTVAGPQLSDVVTLPVLGAGTWLAHDTVVFGGQAIVGGVLSSTTMICKQVALLPQSSVAVHVRLIVYSCGHAPAMVTSPRTTNKVASHASLVVGIPVVAGSVLAEQEMVTFAGHVITGLMLSSIVMSCVHVAVLPHTSVAVHVLVIVYGHGPVNGPSAEVMVYAT